MLKSGDSLRQRLGFALALVSPSPAAAAIFFVFGGCCANIYTLETITQTIHAGAGFTFCQFVGTTSVSFVFNMLTTTGRHAMFDRTVPATEYAKVVACHFSTSYFGNLVLSYQVSVPTMILLRSGGPIVTMGMGWLQGKHYTLRQSLYISLLTAGIVLSAFASRPQEQIQDSASSIDVKNKEFLFGVFLMVLTALISSYMGLLLERIFRVYSPPWQEPLFYTHFLSIFCFIVWAPSLGPQLREILDSTSVDGSRVILPTALNIVTQFICVAGVNLLASVSSALTVSVVLNLRKFTSLAISFWSFGHAITLQAVLGAAMVFAGALGYSAEPPPRSTDLPFDTVGVETAELPLTPLKQ